MSSPTTTAEAIRDRMLTVVEGLVPRTQPKLLFRRFKPDGRADFPAWVRGAGEAAWRRVHIRTVTDVRLSIVNSTVEERLVTYQVDIAYLQTDRAGKHGALDRDDMADADRLQIMDAIGERGRENFTAPLPDACWRSSDPPQRIEGEGADFVRLVLSLSYMRAVTP